MSQAPIEQATAVPYRRQGPRLEFCLITTSRGTRWGFPKGIIEPGQTPREAALMEALEEAGLHGEIEGEELGGYAYTKWNRVLTVRGYLMRVTQEDDHWLEWNSRRRVWCSLGVAQFRIDRPALQRLLAAAAERLK
jgi:8-oxo-dGTP pyrophosphatase MutT (NUDIX family)